MMLKTLILLIWGAFCAPNQEKIDDFLESLYRNPKETLAKIPEKSTNQPASGFTTIEVLTHKYLDLKTAGRRKVIKSGSEFSLASPMAAFAAGNATMVDDFFDNQPIEKNIDQIHTLQWTKNELAIQPWSDSYWPIYQGGAAYRYADGEVNSTQLDWKVNYDNRQWPPGPQTSEDISKLSPAEKYDLLVGDTSYGLTNYMWKQGKMYYDELGEVESWMGYCHGWAAAAMCEERPTVAIEVKSANGQTIPFYPSDIKALGTVLWSNGEFNTRFIGGRCNIKEPEVDKIGRIKDQDCFDVNPGIWHMALVNQLGKNRRSMVLDATYDYEVWNQPIVGYSYTYFSPITRLKNDDPKLAMVDYAEFKTDLFTEYRSKDVKKIIGVAMELTFVAETEPSNLAEDSSDNDLTHTVTYFYDLELDEHGEILGGEWYHNAHPDFLWVPMEESLAWSPVDSWLQGEWDINSNEPMPEKWTRAAELSSSMGIPLATVVRKLFKKAHKTETRGRM